MILVRGLGNSRLYRTQTQSYAHVQKKSTVKSADRQYGAQFASLLTATKGPFYLCGADA